MERLSYRKWRQEMIRSDLNDLIRISEQLVYSNSELYPTAKKIIQISHRIAELNNVKNVLEGNVKEEENNEKDIR